MQAKIYLLILYFIILTSEACNDSGDTAEKTGLPVLGIDLDDPVETRYTEMLLMFKKPITRLINEYIKQTNVT